MAKKDKFNDYDETENYENVHYVSEDFERFIEDVDFNLESEYDFINEEVDQEDKDYKKFESAIRETKIFKIDREKNPGAYNYEREKLLENIFMLRKGTRVSYDTKYTYSDFSLEMVMATDRCVKSFNPERGTEFLHYLNRALSIAVNCACAQDKRAGMPRPPKAIAPIIKKVKKYMQANDIESVLAEDIVDIADFLELDQKDVKEAIEYMGIHIISIEYGRKGDGDKASTLDLPSDIDIEDNYIQKEQTEFYMRAFEKQFAKVKESQKYIIATMATALLCARIEEYNIDVSSYSFILKKDVENFKKYRKIKRQSDLAREYGVDNATISVPWNRFCQKLAKENGGDLSKKPKDKKNDKNAKKSDESL